MRDITFNWYNYNKTLHPKLPKQINENKIKFIIKHYIIYNIVLCLMFIT